MVDLTPMPDRKQAFVAGATGLTGRYVVQHLRARSVRTIAHVRPDSGRLGEWRQRFTGMGATVDTTAWEAEAMQATLRRIRPAYVFALLGTTRKRTKRDGQDYDAIDYGLTAMLIDACDEPLRFVYLSAVGVSENSSGAYMAARWKAETHLREAGLPFTIARPSIIDGNRDQGRFGEKVGAVLGGGVLSMLGALGAKRLAGRYRPIEATDLAQALVNAALDPAQENQVLEGPELRAQLG